MNTSGNDHVTSALTEVQDADPKCPEDPAPQSTSPPVTLRRTIFHSPIRNFCIVDILTVPTGFFENVTEVAGVRRALVRYPLVSGWMDRPSSIHDGWRIYSFTNQHPRIGQLHTTLWKLCPSVEVDYRTHMAEYVDEGGKPTKFLQA